MIVIEAAALGGLAWVVTQALFLSALKMEYTDIHALFFIAVTVIVYMLIEHPDPSIGAVAVGVALAETWRVTLVLISNATQRMLVLSRRR